MADLRRRPTILNATAISSEPVTSNTPVNNQSLVYNATNGYWEWQDVVVPTAAATTFQGETTFDGTLRIGENGTPLTRLSAYLLPHLNYAYATNVGDTITHTPSAFPSAPVTLKVSISDETDSQNALNKTTMVRTPNTTDEFAYVVRNIRNAVITTTIHPDALAIV